jgi:transposase
VNLIEQCQPKSRNKSLKRGLFKSSNGRVINADINGSIQIIRKYLPEAFTALGSSELCRAANTGQSSLKD